MIFTKEKKHVFFLLLSIGFVLTFYFSLSKKVSANCGCSSGYYCPTTRTVQYKDGCTSSCGQNYSTGTQRCCDGVNCVTTTGFAAKSCVKTGWGCYEEAASSRIGEACCEKSACTPYSGCYCGSLATSNQGYGSKTVYCSDGCGGTTSSTCYCYACSIPSCPSGTSTSGDYGFKTTVSCTNSCGNSRANSCYCTSACTLPSCDSGTSTTGTGSLKNTKTCTNNCNQTRSQNCYYVCTPATCSGYEDPNNLTWQDTNPGGYREQELTIPISNPPSGCPTTTTKTCYTPNQQPILNSIAITPIDPLQSLLPSSTRNNLFTEFTNTVLAADSKLEVLGYTSNDHSGTELNNLVQLTAIYSDPDGATDIQAAYVWWSPESNKDNFETPIKIDTTKTPKTDYKDNWGFMVTKNNSVYVPYITSTEKLWIPIQPVGGIYKIPSTISGQNMVELSNISFTANGSQVQLQGLLKFLENDKVKTEQYNLWGMANDTYGFTAYQTGGNIKDNDIWQDSGTNWTIDMVQPAQPVITTSTGENQIINLSFTVTDNEPDTTVTDDLLSYVRVDACYSGDGTPQPLSVSGGNTNYILESCDSVGSFSSIDINDDPDLIHSTTPIPILNTSTFSTTNPLEVNIGSNNAGSITFYVTAMDKSGNYNQSHTTYKLNDWVVVENGLVFGATGVSSPTRLLETDSWSGTTSNIIENGFLIEDNLDLTNQVLLGGKSSTLGFLQELVRSSENLSFKVSNFPGVPITSIYSELMDIYNAKKTDSPELFDEQHYTAFGDVLSESCDTSKYCVISSDTDIVIPEDFTCNGHGLITSGGNITITPDFINNTNSDACILLANGNITIKPGSTDTENVHYDLLQAFLIAGNNIIIEEDPSEDGLIVEGGLIAFGNESSNLSNILNSRTISWGYRNSYPVIAVNNNAKYGLLSRDIFGSQVEIFRLEIGFKPY